MTFLLAHLTDAHIGPLPPAVKRELIGKRFTGWLNWTRGRHALHNMGVLGRIVEDIRAHKPDHVAMTGDVMNIALAGEFPLAKAWLDSLGPRDAVSFVPGNHDAYTRASMPVLARTFAPWTCADGATTTHFPYLRVRGGVALIGLCSGVPTAPFIASGRLGSEQRDEFARLLRETGERDLARVVMIHHPPYRKGATPGRGLSDARAFEALIARHGAELVIHGHNHRRMTHLLPRPHGFAPVIAAASASAVPGSLRHRAGWNLYAIEKRGKEWTVDMRSRGLLPESDVIGDTHRERFTVPIP